jgi:hypothetical protein
MQQQPELERGGLGDSPAAECSSVHEAEMNPKDMDETGEAELTWTLDEEAQALKKLDWNLIPL